MRLFWMGLALTVVLATLPWVVPVALFLSSGASLEITAETSTYPVGTPEVTAGERAPADYTPGQNRIRIQPGSIRPRTLAHESLHALDHKGVMGYRSEEDPDVRAGVDGKTYATQKPTEWIASAAGNAAAIPDARRVLGLGVWIWLLPISCWFGEWGGLILLMVGLPAAPFLIAWLLVTRGPQWLRRRAALRNLAVATTWEEHLDCILECDTAGCFKPSYLWGETQIVGYRIDGETRTAENYSS